MKHFLKTIFIYFLLISTAFAQVPGTPVPLKKGEKAPADGVFLFTVDAAKLLGNLQSSDDRCLAITETAVEKAKAPLTLKLRLCTDQVGLNQELTDTKLTAKDEYIQHLEKRVANPGISRSWVLFGGLVTGVLLTIGAGVAMNAAAAN